MIKLKQLIITDFKDAKDNIGPVSMSETFKESDKKSGQRGSKVYYIELLVLYEDENLTSFMSDYT